MKKQIKTLVVAAGVLLAVSAANAQGTFNFLTFNAAPELGVVSVDTGGLAGALYSGQIFGSSSSTDPGAFVAFGNVGTFITTAGGPQGVINGGAQTVAGIGAGTVVNVVLRAWDTASGSYEQALLTGTSGQSQVFQITLGGGSPPLASQNVNAFSNFTLTTVPEPSVIALAILGAGALYFRRKKA